MDGVASARNSRRTAVAVRIVMVMTSTSALMMCRRLLFFLKRRFVRLEVVAARGPMLVLQVLSSLLGSWFLYISHASHWLQEPTKLTVSQQLGVARSSKAKKARANVASPCQST